MSAPLWLPRHLGALGSPVDMSPDGKALETTASSQYISIGDVAPLIDMTTYTVVMLLCVPSHSGGQAIVAKSEDMIPATGWTFASRTDGALWWRAGRTGTTSYITTETPLEPIDSWVLLMLSVDHGAGAGALAEFDFARVYGGRIGRLTRCALSTATDSSGAFASDAGQPFRIANSGNGTSGQVGKYGWVAVYPKLTIAERERVAADPLAWRRSARGFWRPGHRGQNKVIDESGNGNDGTIVGTARAVSGLRGLWSREITGSAKAPGAPQTVTLTPAIATATAPNASVTLGGLAVALAAAIATGPVPQGNVNLGVTLGGVTVALTEAVATATARDLTVIAPDLSSTIVSKPPVFAHPRGLVDHSMDGKAIRLTAATDRVSFGSPTLLTDRTSFTAILVVKPTVLEIGKGLLSKRMAGASSNGWGSMWRAGGELWVRWARSTGASVSLSYITDEIIGKVGEYCLLVLTVDQAAAPGSLVELEYARWDGWGNTALRRATFGTAQDGSGAYNTDSAQSLRLGAYSNSGTDAALGDHVFAGIWPKLSLDDRQRIAADPLQGRDSALGWWRPGQRGNNRVIDESGHGHDGTLSLAATSGARSSLRDLWRRDWMYQPAKRGVGPQTVALSPAVATAVAVDLNVPGSQTVSLAAAVASAVALDISEGLQPFWLRRQRWQGTPMPPIPRYRLWRQRLRAGLSVHRSEVGHAQASPQTIALTPAIATAIAANVTVPTGILVPLGTAVASAVAPNLAVTLGGLTVPVSAAVATGVSGNLVTLLGGLHVSLSAASASALSADLVVTLGGLTVPLSPASANGVARDISAFISTGTTVDPAIATAVATALTATLGGLVITLDAAVAVANVPNVTVTLGSVAVPLTPAIASGVASPVVALQGLSVPLGEAIAQAIAPNVQATHGVLVVALAPAISQAIADNLVLQVGGLSVPLSVAVATAIAPAGSATLTPPITIVRATPIDGRAIRFRPVKPST